MEIDRKSEIFSQRLVVAVVWNILLQTVIAVLLVFLIQVDLIHPITWLTSTVTDICGWKMIVNIILLAAISFFQAYIYGSYYMKPLPKYFSRFSMFTNIFNAQNCTFGILYGLCGYITMGLYSSLAKSIYNELTKECDVGLGVCLMEESLFLQFGGMWMGLYYFTKNHLFENTNLLFPHIYQDKFQQIKIAVGDILSNGFKDSTTPVIYYCIFYYIWGCYPRDIVTDVYDLDLEEPLLDNILNLLFSGIWIGLWFYTSLFFVSIYTMKTIFTIVLTEPMKFPIEAQYELSLVGAMSQKYQFNGCLAAMDLKIMGVSDKARRSQIFTLSQPGGHPRNWESLLDKCIVIIKDFSNELNVINEGRPIEVKNKINSFGSPETFKHEKLRNLADSPKLLELRDHNRNEVPDNISSKAKNELRNLLVSLGQKPGLNYFFGELADTKLKYLLMQAQPVMWTCEGLAAITAASLQEDKYGIVQNDLGVIITTLVNLKQNLDKLSKLGLVPRKQILNDAFAIKMKLALMSAVKRSLYKIVNTFSKYIKEIPLGSEVSIAIQPFLLCKEA